MHKTLSYAGLVLGALAFAAVAAADVEDRLYDFTDAYYRSNGINPLNLVGRRQADGTFAVADKPIFAFQRDVRALFTIGGWSDGGKPTYWTVLAGFDATAFTPDSRGKRAKELADRSAEFIFPQRGTNPTGLGAPRQPFMLDLSQGYFSNNVLGLWVHVWVNFTDKAFNTTGGQQALADLARKNGYGTDGTPMIRTKSEIENLFSKGYVTKTTLPLNDPLRYAVCPVVEDPTDGGIAVDQWLFQVRKADGTPLVRSIDRNFEWLRLTGDWAN